MTRGSDAENLCQVVDVREVKRLSEESGGGGPIEKLLTLSGGEAELLGLHDKVVGR